MLPAVLVLFVPGGYFVGGEPRWSEAVGELLRGGRPFPPPSVCYRGKSVQKQPDISRRIDAANVLLTLQRLGPGEEPKRNYNYSRMVDYVHL